MSVCVPPPQYSVLSSDVQNAIRENPRNATLSLAPSGNDGPLELALIVRTFWEAGRVLNVSFLGGSQWQHEQVMRYAPQWTEYANISFSFESPDVTPDILISFDGSGGSWSAIGTDSANLIAIGQPSMNLGWINGSKSAEDIQGVILHEFGHALGCVHEHESPRADIKWNKDVVYAALGGPPSNWSREKIDHNMFTAYPADGTSASAFDPSSVMLYYFPASWTLDGKGTKENNSLSDQDKDHIEFCYPGKGLGAGFFNTLEIRNSDAPSQQNVKTRNWQLSYSITPRSAVGLNMIDMSCNTNLRLSCSIENATAQNFTASITSWDDSILYTGGMTWVEAGPGFDTVRMGTFHTTEVRPSNKPQAETSKRIIFHAPFAVPPKVVVWLSAFGMDKGANWRIKTYATDVGKDGFTVHVDSWADTMLYSASVNWLAYPADSTRIGSGTFSTDDIRSWENPRAENAGIANFTAKYTKTPKVVLALSSFDYQSGKNLRLRLGTSLVTPTQLNWHLQSWSDSVMYSASASYLTFE
ncbi:hypothetical protein TWF694_009177 [Orbilia ellipsospora]|uniref:H-type lectin domain-containing protein n=1 Tax=Orbilia ellipsospora TaxID=2528407 RepID=A0AAV9XEL2_9PEZI